MKKFLNNIANLVKVKTLVTLAMMVLFSVLALRGDVKSDSVVYIFNTVVAFYFGTQVEK